MELCPNPIWTIKLSLRKSANCDASHIWGFWFDICLFYTTLIAWKTKYSWGPLICGARLGPCLCLQWHADCQQRGIYWWLEPRNSGMVLVLGFVGYRCSYDIRKSSCSIFLSCTYLWTLVSSRYLPAWWQDDCEKIHTYLYLLAT